MSHRSRTLGALLLAPVFAVAGEGILGTKVAESAPMSAGTPGVGLGAMVQMAIAVAIVGFIVKWLMPKALAKFGNRLSTNLQGGLRVEESATFPGGQLYIIQARGKSLLISMTSSGVTLLSDLTEQTPKPPVDTFEDFLERAPGIEVPVIPPSDPIWEMGAEAPEPSNDVLSQLERLKRIAGS